MEQPGLATGGACVGAMGGQAVLASTLLPSSTAVVLLESKRAGVEEEEEGEVVVIGGSLLLERLTSAHLGAVVGSQESLSACWSRKR